jgi:hypothetical protein
VNTHVTLIKKWDSKYIIGCELDLFPTIIDYSKVNNEIDINDEKHGTLKLAMIDTKLTVDVHSTFGDFGWGNPKFLDHIQADMYHWIIRDVDFELNPNVKNIFTDRVLELIKHDEIHFFYWVFGYKEPLEQQMVFIERMYRDENGSTFRQSELKERIRKTIEVIEREAHFGWSENPVYEICRTCPINSRYGGDCKSSISVKV